MFHKVMIVLPPSHLSGARPPLGCTRLATRTGEPSLATLISEGPLRSLVIQTSTVMFPEALEPGLVTSIWVLKVTVASPTRDYGLYTPHFC
jgi:hypothetical protein